MYKLDENKFKNVELERLLIAGILKYPDTYFDISNIIKSEDFSFKLHSIIWTVTNEILTTNKTLDFHLIALKINNLKINFGLELTVSEYLEAVSMVSLGGIDSVNIYAARLKTLSGKKNAAEAALETYNKLEICSNELSYYEIANLADSTFNSKINLFSENGFNEPTDLYKGLEQEIEQQGNEQKDYGIICPHKILRAKYGDFYPGDLYVWASRMKSGKSLFLMNLLHSCCNNSDQNVVGILVDTEMTTKEIRWRLMSMLTGIGQNHFRKGTWRNNKAWTEKVRSTWPIINTFFDRIQHLYVGNIPIEEVCIIIRRWYRKNIANKENIQGLVIYDYIKINADLVNNRYSNMKGNDLAGYKTDCLKKLGTEINCPILTSVQTNRFNASKKTSERLDDTTVVALSDQIGMYASNMYLFNSLALDEIQELNVEYGLDATHRMVPLVTRQQGDEAPGFNGNYVKIENEDGQIQFLENVLYYKFENFHVQELAQLSDLVNSRKDYKLSDKNSNDGEMLN